MEKFLHNLRKKPEPHRQMIAFLVSFFVVLVVFCIWGVYMIQSWAGNSNYIVDSNTASAYVEPTRFQKFREELTTRFQQVAASGKSLFTVDIQPPFATSTVDLATSSVTVATTTLDFSASTTASIKTIATTTSTFTASTTESASSSKNTTSSKKVNATTTAR